MNSIKEELRPMTLLLVGVNIAVFVAEMLAGGSTNAQVALRFGAQYTPLVLSGQWWRLFTSMFLHFGTSHLTTNMITLFFFGNAVERLLGRWKMLLIYLVSGLSGNLLSLAAELWQQDGYALSAGASGAIFGLVGVYVAMALIKELRRFVNARNVVIMLIVNFAYGMDNRSINLTAHVGGLLAGTILSYCMLRWKIGQAGKKARRP